jgi:hypothetical protein
MAWSVKQRGTAKGRGKRERGVYTAWQLPSLNAREFPGVKD